MQDAIRLSNVYKIFSPQTEGAKPLVALNNVSFTISEGSLTVIAGSNGSGKSVLMQIISGLIEKSDGEVYTSSKPGLIFQQAAAQILGDTPREDVEVGPKNMGLSKKDAAVVSQKALEKVSLLHKADYPADFLSGGEKRRLSVASICAMEKNIIIFDEPYANLDYPGIKDVNALIKELHESGKTILILSHELEKCLGLSDHFIVLRQGELVFDGTPEEALKKHAKDFSLWALHNPLTSYNLLSDLVW